MESAKHYFQKLFFLVGERLGIVIVFVIALFLVLSNTAIKAYSESETQSYRQESVFANPTATSSEQNIPEINPSPAAGEEPEQMAPISMSYDVDKITPTPTPIFDPSDNTVWLKLAECESHQNWQDDTGNGYYGGLQFSLGAWASVGGGGKPSDASKDEQIVRGKILQQRRGWGPWGGCSKKLGLR